MLESIRKESKNEFLSNPILSSAAERNLQMIIEVLLDLGNHVIRKNNYPAPEKYTDIFEILCDRKILPEEKKDGLIKLAKFRNILVHLYTKIDKAQVYDILQNNFTLFKETAAQLIKNLQ